MCLVDIKKTPLFNLKIFKRCVWLSHCYILQALQNNEMPEEDMFTLRDILDRLLMIVMKVIEK